jgi:ABC-type transporter Mla subunit MlaD
MLQHDGQNLEQALGRTEADAAATLKAADALTKSLRRFRTAAKEGNLRNLHSSIESAEGAMAVLRQQFANAKEGWNGFAQKVRELVPGNLVNLKQERGQFSPNLPA